MKEDAILSYDAEGNICKTGNHVCYFGDKSVQIITKNREPWFLVQDVGEMLELTNIRANLRQIPKEEKSICYAHVSKGGFTSQRQRMSVVSEAGLYELITMSHTEEAKKFKAWLFKEVLVSIRKTGKYELRKDTAFFTAKGANPVRAAVKTRFRLLEWPKEDKKLELPVS